MIKSLFLLAVSNSLWLVIFAHASGTKLSGFPSQVLELQLLIFKVEGHDSY